MHPATRRTILASLALIVMTFVAYLPALHAGYIWDDDDYVINNTTLRDAHGLRRIWFEIGATPQYYPLVHTTFWAQYQLTGLQPAPYHFVNIALHAAAAVMFFRLLSALRIPGGDSAAWLAAAIFAVHPVHVESVAWVTERKNTLMIVFYLGSFLAYMRHRAICEDTDTMHDSAPEKQNSTRHAFCWLLASFLLFVCAMLSKTVAASLPVAILLAVWFRYGRLKRRDFFSLLPYFAVGVPLGLLTASVEKSVVKAVGPEWDLSFLQRCLIAGRAIVFYAWKLIAPINLSFIYERWTIDAGAIWQYIFPLGVAVVVVGLWLKRREWGLGPLFAVLFFIATLGPALGFFNIYPMRYSFVADHFQYHASLGLIALASSVAVTLVQRRGAVAFARGRVVAVLILFVLTILTARQCFAYDNVETIWRDTIGKNRTAWIAFNNLGKELASQGKHNEAILNYREAVNLKPDHAGAWSNLAASLNATRDAAGAIESYRRALAIEPESAVILQNLGGLLGDHGKPDEAIKLLSKAAGIAPKEATIRFNLGLVEVRRGNIDAGIQAFNEALQLKPDYAEAMNQIGVAYARRDDLPRAIAAFEAATKMNPKDTLYRDNLDTAQAKFRESQGAPRWPEPATRPAP